MSAVSPNYGFFLYSFTLAITAMVPQAHGLEGFGLRLTQRRPLR